MGNPRGESRDAILEAAHAQVCDGGAASITVDGVASKAGCAKGLVHYHFKTKQGLLQAVAQRLTDERESRWRRAFDARTPKAAIGQTWGVLTKESEDGTIRAWTSLFVAGDLLPDQTARDATDRFSQTLGAAAVALSENLDLAPTVPPSEIGLLLGAVIHGMGLQPVGGADRGDLEGAYAAAWLGILSLFAPRQIQ